ncbi:MAG: SDR family oxidoreductase [Chitinispirillaceae bacterium]
MEKLLVTGASGLLGGNLCREAVKDRRYFSVRGTFLSTPLSGVPFEVSRCDLNAQDQVSALLDDFRPGIVIHCAAMSSPDKCEEKRQEAETILAGASGLLARLCRARDIKLVFISSDMVFDGCCAPYREEDEVIPVNYYGELKVFAERMVLNESGDNLVCRLPLLFGAGYGSARSFIQGWVQLLQEGREVKAFVDEFRTPVEASCAARGILDFAAEKSGVLHLGGRERISRYDFALRLTDVFGLRKELVRGSCQKSVRTPARRPSDVSLDSSRAFGCGYDPGTLTDGLIRLRDRIRPADQAAGRDRITSS